jgi:large conductance mechanosensitive channel
LGHLVFFISFVTSSIANHQALLSVISFLLTQKPNIMGMLKEFKDFAMKGNVIDLAVGVVIGAAFGKIVSSLVDDVITPLILAPALKAANPSNIAELKWGAVKYGNFLSSALSFIVIAFVLFLVIKGINKMKKEEPPAPPAEPSSTDKLLMEIRDNLRK